MASVYPNLPQEEKPLERCGFESEPTFDPQCTWEPAAWGGMMKTWAGRKGYAFAKVNNMLGGTGLAAGEGAARGMNHAHYPISNRHLLERYGPTSGAQDDATR